MSTRKDRTKSEILAREHQDKLILQNAGLFYCAYDESACVLSDLTDFQLIQMESGRLRCSCLADKWEETQEIVEAAHVSYIFIKKEAIIAQNDFEDNKFRFYADGSHVPDSIRNQSGSSTDTQINCNSNKTVSNDEIKRYNNAVAYTQRLCDGLDPVTGKVASNISLEDPNVMRYLFYIKEFLQKNEVK
ncbi:MAG: hypothetical protein PHY47_15925 [Lachnospiraceae bacterium]|nr:hypothetical protein [Lachnospiraceae bacterium]